jgi:hypothetical protein
LLGGDIVDGAVITVDAVDGEIVITHRNPVETRDAA